MLDPCLRAEGHSAPEGAGFDSDFLYLSYCSCWGLFSRLIPLHEGGPDSLWTTGVSITRNSDTKDLCCKVKPAEKGTNSEDYVPQSSEH